MVYLAYISTASTVGDILWAGHMCIKIHLDPFPMNLEHIGG